MSKKKVLVAMSGGVDSSAAAALLLEQGYEVAGATMQIWPKGETENNPSLNEAVNDARTVAKKLGIEHFVFDLSREFSEKVIAPFIDDYLNGRTPNPCVFCNKQMKFGLFLDKALEMGYDFIATGHYAKIKKDSDGYHLMHSAFDSKDQTYVLYNMTQHVLEHLILPVGDMDKSEIRKYAEIAGIEVANKPDSQEICFVPDDDYAKYILEHSDYTDKKGNFIDINGDVIGEHMGIIHYTVGQRKGLGVAFGEPRYVVEVDAKDNRVMLGKNEDTFSSSLIAEKVNFVSGNLPCEAIKVEAKIRYGAKSTTATVIPEKNGLFRVDFDSPVRAVTAGQSVVFYNGDEVLGGGIIARRN